MSTIAKMRENTWNGVLPGDNNAVDSVPFNRKNSGTKPYYPETSKAGIKVSEIDQFPLRAQKGQLKLDSSIKTYTDFTNTNYPADAAEAPATGGGTTPAPTPPTPPAPPSTGDEDDTEDDEDAGED
jgi:hypothetical protein